MPKKIYDIKPPKEVSKTGKESKKEISGAVKIKRRASATPHRQKKENHSSKTGFWLYFWVGISIIIIGVGIYLFFSLPKANIVIWPRVETMSFKQTITADKSAQSVDLAKAVIPVQYLQVAKTNSQNFPATGNGADVGQASGTITIYNKYNPPMPFNFKAGTHFMSDSGKLFVASQKITIPAATKSGSKIIPGTVQVSVQAVEGGSSYNIAPSNFSIPGLKGTAYYYGVSATSESPMTGGYSGKVKKVTADDIQGAKDVLTKKTTSDAVTALKNQLSSDYILLDKAILSNTTSASTQTKPGTIADSFNYQVAITASALAFKKSDLDKFAKNYIISQIPDGKTLLDKNFTASYLTGTVDVSGGKAVLNLDFSSGVYQNINKNSMALSLLGENTDQIKATISSSLGGQISKTEINFWPFWVFSAPNNQNKVNIELKFQ
ncbi:MAG: hypothetical protein NT155_03520 [Candidatus Staskawiczbacteria bacterium]|nr:hypothetical protein [Candidatus Staskawiczbacteria bacterium]